MRKEAALRSLESLPTFTLTRSCSVLLSHSLLQSSWENYRLRISNRNHHLKHKSLINMADADHNAAIAEFVSITGASTTVVSAADYAMKAVANEL